MYNSQLGRWWSVDPLAGKNSQYSPYHFVKNSPAVYIDPDGRDAYLIIYATADGDFGHAVLAVDLYDEDGNATGKVRYFQLNPKEDVKGLKALRGVKPDYGVSISPVELDKLINTNYLYRQLSFNEEEASVPDGAIRIKTNQETDGLIIAELLEARKTGKKYNASKYNCTDYVCEGLSVIIPEAVELAEEKLFIGKRKSRTPNKLFRELAKRADTDEVYKVIKYPKNDKEKKLFFEGAGYKKLGRRQRRKTELVEKEKNNDEDK